MINPFTWFAGLLPQFGQTPLPPAALELKRNQERLSAAGGRLEGWRASMEGVLKSRP